jgi:formate dehydrogenase alpha subunit
MKSAGSTRLPATPSSSNRGHDVNDRPIRAKHARTITIEIDHREVTCQEGVSVLRAAELNGVFIPSLCSHKDLSPFGGCRLCVVEIEGMRGYPLACSTIVQEGMKVLSDTAALREMRVEILELILSEHPSSCLVCGEQDGCRQNQYTIRKSGVSTGCRTCPNDTECELQTLVERLGITDIHYPIYYRGYEAEHEDPFFDRDYNICILCGRCVRMCQEVRGTAVLAFKHRGPRTQIGAAFGRNHVEAGCEFCGACVSVCPTGTLADKVSKWDGKPDSFAVSTCPFCALGCRIELHHKDGRLSKVLPHLDAKVNDGQLCVRGRFCLPETTHHHERARKPLLKRGRYFREVTWDEALDDVAAHLEKLGPADFLMVVSPDLGNESLYVAQKLVRSGLRCNSIDSTARSALPGGVGLWARLLALPISIKAIADADGIVAVGIDSRFSFSVAGVEIRRALREGATLVTIDSRESNLARYAQHWLRPAAGRDGAVLGALVDGLLGAATGGEPRVAGVDRVALDAAVAALAPGRDLAVVVGPTAFAADLGHEIGAALLRLAERERTTFLPLFQGANTRGALELGALGELLPGLEPAPEQGLSLADLLEGRARPRVLYLVGESPFFERPDCDYVIAQDLYRPAFEVDAFLPAASFAEAGGTLTSVEGRVQEVVQVEELPDGVSNGFVRPDWFIFGALAGKLSWPGLRFDSAREILREIGDRVPGFPASPDRRARRLGCRTDLPLQAPATVPDATGGFLLVLEPGSFRHRGIDLSVVVEGLAELGLEEGFRLNPDDLDELGVGVGDSVVLRVDGLEARGMARADADCPRGVIYMCRPHAYGGLRRRQGMAPLYRLGGGLYRVTVSVTGSSQAHGATARDLEAGS